MVNMHNGNIDFCVGQSFIIQQIIKRYVRMHKIATIVVAYAFYNTDLMQVCTR